MTPETLTELLLALRDTSADAMANRLAGWVDQEKVCMARADQLQAEILSVFAKVEATFHKDLVLVKVPDPVPYRVIEFTYRVDP